MANYDDLDDKRIFAVGILSVVVLAVTALAVQVLYYWMVRVQEESTAAKSSYRRENAALAVQSEQISSFGVDPNTAEITIPIDQAIEQLVKQRSSNSDSSKQPNDEA